ncbi:MAG: MFS transporter [Labilithrix sp.]|nr:MFS transporter [Labilithrix sp.]MCW5814666.1 MFS transporter [Labilithrix sp.]
MAARRTNRPLTVVALLLALFMAAMEMTVVSTAMPTVVAELGGALHYAWVFSAYMLTSTVTVPIHGKLADLYGRKPVLLASMAIFLVGSMASGQAHSMTALIAFRAVQGLGAGGLQPIAITVVGDIFDVEERAKMQGLFGAVWGIAGLAGPLLGGVIVAALSWRWVFYVNVPFGLLSAALLAGALHESIAKKDHALDVAGAVLLSLAIVALLLGVEGVAPWVLLPASVALAVAFVVVERRAKEAMLPPRLFRERVLAVSGVLSAVTGAAMIGIVTFVPLYAQGVLGASPTEAGATIAPMAVGWPIASAISGRLLARLGFRTLVRFGMFVVAASTVMFVVTVGRGATAGELRLGGIAFGVGMGFANTALVIAVQTSVSFSERGVATASTIFFRSIGGTVGVGVMGVVLARQLLATPEARAHGGAELVARILGPERKSVATEVLAAIAGDLSRGLLHITWIWGALGAAALVAAWAFPHVERKITPAKP